MNMLSPAQKAEIYMTVKTAYRRSFLPTILTLNTYHLENLVIRLEKEIGRSPCYGDLF
jgi:hypothetical protein